MTGAPGYLQTLRTTDPMWTKGVFKKRIVEGDVSSERGNCQRMTVLREDLCIFKGFVVIFSLTYLSCQSISWNPHNVRLGKWCYDNEHVGEKDIPARNSADRLHGAARVKKLPRPWNRAVSPQPIGIL
jgi:hypothetical protein